MILCPNGNFMCLFCKSVGTLWHSVKPLKKFYTFFFCHLLKINLFIGSLLNSSFLNWKLGNIKHFQGLFQPSPLCLSLLNKTKINLKTGYSLLYFLDNFTSFSILPPKFLKATKWINKTYMVHKSTVDWLTVYLHILF